MSIISRMNGSSNSHVFGVLLCAASFLLASPIFAQHDSTDALEEIVVTGSKIKRTSYDTPTPVEVIDAEMLNQIGANSLNEALMQSPSVGLGQNLSTNADAGNPEGGAVFADLRGLGIDRSLTLIDGRRRVAGSAFSSAVDLSLIPTALIDRVEITTGGAAAVYGADAVSGVLNVSLKKDFDGIDVMARVGDSSEGGGEATAFSISGGQNFDRGYIGFGASYSDQQLLRANERDFASKAIAYSPDENGDVAYWSHRGLLTDPSGVFVNYSQFYAVINDPNSPGGLRPFDFGTAPGSPFAFASNEGDGFHWPDYDMLRSGVETTAAMVYGEFELTESTRLFLELDYAHGVSNDTGQPTYFGDWFPLYGPDNPFLPAQIAADMLAGDAIGFYRTHETLSVTSQENTRDTLTLVASLDGEFASGWTWGLSGQFGTFDLENQFKDDVLWEEWIQASDVTTDGNGSPVCRDPTNGCVPLNMFGRNVESDDARAWLLRTLVNNTENSQTIFSAQLGGEIFELPAGAASFAAGLEHRSETMKIKPDPMNTNFATFYAAGQEPVDADFDVTEAYVEVLVPVVERFNAEAAVRYSDYNTIGQTTAWKLGADWAPLDGLRLRAMKSRSVRAPSLSELFSAGAVFGGFVDDPCDFRLIGFNPNRATNCAALGLPDPFTDPFFTSVKGIYQGGNPDLNEETSDSITFGFVVQPPSWESFRLSVDFWSIEIDDAINTLDPQQIVNGCVDNSPSLDAVLCAEVERDAVSGGISQVNVTDINVSNLATEGYDIQGDYVFGDVLNGSITLSLQLTKLEKFEQLLDANNPDTIVDQKGDYGHPDWRGRFSAAYNSDDFSLVWTGRWIDGATVTNDPALLACCLPPDDTTVPSVIYHDLYGSYQITDNIDVFLGVNNVADKEPPRHPNTYAGNGTFYDVLGRYLFLGAKASFR